MDTVDSALLHPAGVGDVGDRPDERIFETVVLLHGRCTTNLGGVGLGRGGGGGVLGGVAGFGGGNGLRRPCGTCRSIALLLMSKSPGILKGKCLGTCSDTPKAIPNMLGGLLSGHQKNPKRFPKRPPDKSQAISRAGPG